MIGCFLTYGMIDVHCPSELTICVRWYIKSTMFPLFGGLNSEALSFHVFVELDQEERKTKGGDWLKLNPVAIAS